jgi:hypothetical protein
MACELTIIIENRPGSFAALGESLGNAGVNIEGICGFAWEGKYLAHVLTVNTRLARTALENDGIAVQGERDVLLVDLENLPGEFGKLCRKLAIAGINTDLVYLTENNQVVLGVDDLKKAQALLNLNAG